MQKTRRSIVFALRTTFTLVAVCALVATAVAVAPALALAVDYGSHTPGDNMTFEEAQAASDITPDVYGRLGLTVSPNLPEDSVAPLPEDRAFDLISNREVYVAANGTDGSLYTVRNYLENLGPSAAFSRRGKTHDGNGSLYGAYRFYNNSQARPNSSNASDYGSTTDSYLSNNRESVKQKANAGFRGKYATSVAFSASPGKDARDNYVAELRAHGTDKTESLEGESKGYTGLINISLFAVGEDGTRQEVATLTPKLHASQVLGSDGYHELVYLNLGYQQEYDAYFELAAADVDGDGIDELFAYTGAYEDKDGRRFAIVHMMRSSDGSSWSYSDVRLDTGPASNYLTLDELKDRNPNPWNDRHANYWRWQLARMAPVVTIAAGDLDRNGTEEVAFVTSAPTMHKRPADAAACHIFHWDEAERNVVTVDGLGRIALNDSEAATDNGTGRALMSANATFGSYVLPTTLAPGGAEYMVNAFVVAGWQSNDATGNPNGAWKSFAYRYVYYDLDAQAYKVSKYVEHGLGKDARIVADSAARKTGGSKRYMPVVAPFALGSARLESLGSGAHGEHVLAGGDVYAFNLGTGFAAAPVGSMSLYSGHYHNIGGGSGGWGIDDQKSKDHVWIGDVASGCVANDDLGHESFLAVVGVRRDDNVRGSDDYYWMDVAHFTFEKGLPTQIATGQEGVICEGERMGRKWGTYVSLCLPDIDKDSVRMYLVDKTVLPTAPQILAILQDTPYFDELENSYHYLSSSATSFGKGTEDQTTNGFSLNFAGGGHLNAAWGEGPAFQLDVAVKQALGYDWQRANAIARTFTYTAQGGKGDKVVAYALPVAYYRYKTYDPKTDQWDDYYQTVAGDPVSSVLSVDVWNAVATETKSLPVVDDAVIASQSGKPETYVGSPATTGTGLGGQRVFTSEKKDTVATGQGEGGTAAQEISKSTSTSHTVSPSLQINITTGFGFGFLGSQITAGPVIDFAAGYTHARAATNSVSFGGVVDNLPTIPSVAGNNGRYGFTWMLQANMIQLSEAEKAKAENGRAVDEVYLVGYEVTDVVRPKLAMVPDTRVDGVTDKSATLSWLPIDFGEGGDGQSSVYRVGVLDVNGNVSRWDVVDAPAHPTDPTERISHTMGELSPQTTYRFVVEAAWGVRGPGSFALGTNSIPSPVLPARTLATGEVIELLAQPQELEPLDPGRDATYSVTARWELSGTGKAGDISYVWQQWSAKDGTWVELGTGQGDSVVVVDGDGAASAMEALANKPKGATSTTGSLTIRNVTPRMDGNVYRCSVGFDQQTIGSSSVVLRVLSDDIDAPIVSEQPRTITTRTSTHAAVWFSPTEGGQEGDDPDQRDDDSPDDERDEGSPYEQPDNQGDKGDRGDQGDHNEQGTPGPDRSQDQEGPQQGDAHGTVAGRTVLTGASAPLPHTADHSSHAFALLTLGIMATLAVLLRTRP